MQKHFSTVEILSCYLVLWATLDLCLLKHHTLNIKSLGCIWSCLRACRTPHHPFLLLPGVSGHRGCPRHLSSRLALSFLLPGGSPRLLALPREAAGFPVSLPGLTVGVACGRRAASPAAMGSAPQQWGKRGWRAVRWTGWEGLLALPIPNSWWKVTAKLTWHNAEQFPGERCGRCSDNGGSLTCSWKGHVIKLLRTAGTNRHHPSKLTCENI